MIYKCIDLPDSYTCLYGAKGVNSVLYFLNGKSLFLDEIVTESCLLLLKRYV